MRRSECAGFRVPPRGLAGNKVHERLLSLWRSTICSERLQRERSDALELRFPELASLPFLCLRAPYSFESGVFLVRGRLFERAPMWHRRSSLVAVALVAILQCGGAEVGVFPDATVQTRSVLKVRPGQVANFGIPMEPPTISGVLRILGAKLVGVPKGLEVVRLAAFRPSEFGTGLGTYRGDLQANPKFRAYPVTKIELKSGTTSDWYVVVTLRASIVGDYRVDGIDLSFRVDHGKGHQFLTRVLEVQVIDCAREPSRAPFVCSDANSGHSASPRATA
jgi:hypothetical protein